MNKIRYWKRILEYCNIIYRNSKGNVLTRAFSMICMINDHLFNLEEDEYLSWQEIDKKLAENLKKYNKELN